MKSLTTNPRQEIEIFDPGGIQSHDLRIRLPQCCSNELTCSYGASLSLGANTWLYLNYLIKVLTVEPPVSGHPRDQIKRGVHLWDLDVVHENLMFYY